MKLIKDIIARIKNKNGKSDYSSIENAEDEIIQAGKNAVRNTLNDHFKVVDKIQNNYELTNASLICSNIEANKDISKSLRKSVASLGTAIRAMIIETARKVENRTFLTVEEAIKNIKFNKLQTDRANSICSGQKEIRASYQSLRVSIEVFRRINYELLNEIKESKTTSSSRKQIDLLLKNSILVYELANVIVNILEEFQLKGKDILLTVRQEIINEIKKNKDEDDKLLLRYKDNTDVSDALLKGAINDINLREQNRNIVMKLWNDMVVKIEEMEKNVTVIQKQISNLSLLRDNAKNQLDFLQIVTVTQMMKDNLDAVEGLLQIDEIPLATLTPDYLCDLLGIKQNHYLESLVSQRLTE